VEATFETELLAEALPVPSVRSSPADTSTPSWSSIGRRRQPKARGRVGAPPASRNRDGRVAQPWQPDSTDVPLTRTGIYQVPYSRGRRWPKHGSLARHGSVTKEEESLARLRTYSHTYERTSCLAPDVRADRWSPVGRTSSVARSPLRVGRSCTPPGTDGSTRSTRARTHGARVSGRRYCRALAARATHAETVRHTGRNPILAVTARRVDVHGQMS
jgi:hypothetical protein